MESSNSNTSKRKYEAQSNYHKRAKYIKYNQEVPDEFKKKKKGRKPGPNYNSDKNRKRRERYHQKKQNQLPPSTTTAPKADTLTPEEAAISKIGELSQYMEDADYSTVKKAKIAMTHFVIISRRISLYRKTFQNFPISTTSNGFWNSVYLFIRGHGVEH